MRLKDPWILADAAGENLRSFRVEFALGEPRADLQQKVRIDAGMLQDLGEDYLRGFVPALRQSALESDRERFWRSCDVLFRALQTEIRAHFGSARVKREGASGTAVRGEDGSGDETERRRSGEMKRTPPGVGELKAETDEHSHDEGLSHDAPV